MYVPTNITKATDTDAAKAEDGVNVTTSVAKTLMTFRPTIIRPKAIPRPPTNNGIMIPGNNRGPMAIGAATVS